MSVRELGNRSTLKPREDCLLSSAPEEEITADRASIRPMLMVLSKQSKNLSGTDNWLKEKFINQENTTYNVCYNCYNNYYDIDGLRPMVRYKATA